MIPLDKAVQLVHSTILARKPRRPSNNDWVSVEPVLDFLVVGQVGNIMARLFEAAHKRLEPAARGEGMAPAEQQQTHAEEFLLNMSWHKVAGVRYNRSLQVIRCSDEQFLQRALSVVLEPCRWLASWFTQSAHSLRSRIQETSPDGVTTLVLIR